MNDNKKKLSSLDRFREIAEEKKFHINVCLGVASIVFNSENWEKVAEDITNLAEKSKNCDEFAELLLMKY